ncbi:hypothetical protein [Bradyrhizobium sp. th.b2]|nr:hypothetical protein [Bradyrhizobium sp. th.b2]
MAWEVGLNFSLVAGSETEQKSKLKCPSLLVVDVSTPEAAI